MNTICYTKSTSKKLINKTIEKAKKVMIAHSKEIEQDYNDMLESNIEMLEDMINLIKTEVLEINSKAKMPLFAVQCGYKRLRDENCKIASKYYFLISRCIDIISPHCGAVNSFIAKRGVQVWAEVIGAHAEDYLSLTKLSGLSLKDNDEQDEYYQTIQKITDIYHDCML